MNHLLIDDWFFLLTAHQMISHHFSHASCCVCVCVCVLTRYTPVMSTRPLKIYFFLIWMYITTRGGAKHTQL